MKFYYPFQTLMAILGIVFPVQLPGGEPPPQAPPIDHRLTKIETRLDAIEVKLGLKTCDCGTTGVCLCDARECKCKDCPEHTQTIQATGKVFSGDGQEALFFTADWCQNCPAGKTRMGDSLSEMAVIDCTNGNPLAYKGGLFDVSGYPYVLLVSDGEAVSGYPGAPSYAKSAVQGWLHPEAQSTRRQTTFTSDGDASDDQIRQHLVDAHGYSWSQVSRMNRSQLKAAHNRGHGGPASVSLSYPVRQSFRPVVRYSTGYYGSCPNCPR